MIIVIWAGISPLEMKCVPREWQNDDIVILHRYLLIREDWMVWTKQADRGKSEIFEKKDIYTISRSIKLMDPPGLKNRHVLYVK